MSLKNKRASRARRTARAAISLVILSSLVACTTPLPPTLMPRAQAPVISPAETPSAPRLTEQSLQDESATPALPAASSSEAEFEPAPTGSAYPTPPEPGMMASDAHLLFAAPIPQASEIMEWRPPCVSVPHAIHPNDHYWLRRPIPSGHVDWGLDWYPYGGNGFGQWRVHHGMDFPNDPGTPVLAAADGIVVGVKGNWVPIYVEIDAGETPEEEAIPADENQESEGETDSSEDSEEEPAPAEEDQELEGETNSSEDEDQADEKKPTRRILGPYGNFIIIRHDWGWHGEPVYTLYGHLLEVFVQEGDRVKAGDLIAGVGNTGASSGPHLHLEVRVGENDYNYTVNPALWIAPYEGWGTLAGRVTTARGNLLYNAILTITPADLNREPAQDDIRTLTTYADSQGRPDELWAENFVVPDLPAGEYLLSVRAGGEVLRATVAIRPGVTTFVKVHTSSDRAAASTIAPTPAGAPD